MRTPSSLLRMFVALYATSAVAQSQGETPLDIQSQVLAEALNKWAQAAGFQIIVPSAASRHLTPRLQGEFTSKAALDRLLAGTELAYEFIDERTVAIYERRAAVANVLQLAATQSEGTDQSAPTYMHRGAPLTDRFERESSLEEVIVTAQKREEQLQDVPISISVLDGARLDTSTVQGLTEMLNRVPGVSTTVAPQGSGTQIAVRGVTSGGPVFNGSSPVSYYVDSVPFGFVKSAIGPDINPYDLERVEVLRGPQGTLYGASAQNGVVRVLTKDPNLDGLDFKVRTSVSSTKKGGENYRGDMALNVPIVEGKLAARAAVGYQNLSGWVDKSNERDVNDAEIQNFRLKLGAKPSEQFSVGLSAWISRGDFGDLTASNENARRALEYQFDESISADYDVFGLQLGYDFDAFTVSSRTGYVDYTNRGTLDFVALGLPGFALSTQFDSEVLSEEFIVNSSLTGPWQWSIGGMYRDGEDHLLQKLPGLLPAPISLADGSESYAVFGEVRRRVFKDQFEWTLGLRYFHDDGINEQTLQPFARQYASFEATTPRAVLTWYPRENLTAYASYAQGFRSGFPQNTGLVPASFRPLRPDKLNNYEIGAKGDMLDQRVSFEAAVYYIHWNDVQQTRTVNFNDVPVTALVNGDSASGIGVDFAVTTRPVDGLQLGINSSWNDLTMDVDVFSQGILLFAAGDRLNISPEWTAAASADYAFPLQRLQGHFAVSANYVSEQDQRSIFSGRQVIAMGEPSLIAQTSFSIDSPDRWTATFFIDNVTNEQSSVRRNAQAIPVPDWDLRPRPRTFGVQLEYRLE